MNFSIWKFKKHKWKNNVFANANLNSIERSKHKKTPFHKKEFLIFE